MFRPRIIPVLLLKGLGLVKTKQFNKKKARYIGDPINAVRIFNDLESDELIFLDIDASREKRSVNIELIKKIGDEAFMPFSVGGGIDSVDKMRTIFTSGAEKVVINTAAVLNPGLIREASGLFGNQSIVVSVDIKKNIFGKYDIYIYGGEEKAAISLSQHLRNMEEAGAGEVFINFMDYDGMMNGYDLSKSKELVDSMQIPVIICGGAGHPDHMRDLNRYAHPSAIAAGSMFVYHGARNGILINYLSRDQISSIFK